MNFITYDLILMVLFLIFVSLFLYKKRKNLKKEGWLILYRATWGMKLINYVGNKYKRTINFLSYISIGLGYFLMAVMFYLIGKTIYIYVAFPAIVRAIKIPPIMPLVPYFTELPGIKGIFPTFYFIDFILAIIIVATVHELSHGIFMKRYGIKIKSTGIAFLKYFPVFLGAFVEQDEKSMTNKKKFEQMGVLSAGVFANVITGILFFGFLWIFFISFFVPAGVVFDDYVYSVVVIGNITMINEVAVENPSYEKLAELIEDNAFNKIEVDGKKFIGIKGFSEDKTQVALYHDAPAINAKLKGAIIEINNEKIISLDGLTKELAKYNPGEKVIIKTAIEEEIKEYEIELEEHPEKPGSTWLGIGFINKEAGFNILSPFKKPHVYYESKIKIGLIIYNLLWWIVLINLAVALFNMLPVGGLDGGRFFYLTILAITGKESWAKNSFKWLTTFFLLLLLAIMGFWAYAIFF